MTSQHVETQVHRQIIESAHDAFIMADPDGYIRLWNVGAERLFGYTASEAIGQRLDLIIPERNRATHWAGYNRVMQTGETKYSGSLLAVPAIHKDGSRISVEFTVVLLKDGTGRVQGITAIMRDVTVRREQERAQRDRLRALETKVRELGGDPEGT